MVDRDELMKMLRDFGIKKVLVNYSGGGDSGQIDDVSFDPDLSPEAKEATVVMEKTVGIHEDDIWVDVIRSYKATIQEAVEQFCDKQIGDLHGGYENDHGGFGFFVIDVDADTVKFNHSDYVQTTQTWEYDL